MIVSGLLFAAAAAAPQAAIQPSAQSSVPWSASRYSSKVTECDRLIAHPDDPNKLTPGVSQKKADLPRAIAACEKAVAEDPQNPRLNYQLARAYGYSGLGKKAYPYRAVAVNANYPQSLFVIGYITLFGMNEQPKDVCLGADLIRRSAQVGRIAGQVAYPHYWLKGMFDACPNQASKEEMLGFLEAGKKAWAGDYYKETLIELLERDINAR